jgi:hypothetical protein
LVPYYSETNTRKRRLCLDNVSFPSTFYNLTQIFCTTVPFIKPCELHILKWIGKCGSLNMLLKDTGIMRTTDENSYKNLPKKIT